MASFVVYDLNPINTNTDLQRQSGMKIAGENVINKLAGGETNPDKLLTVTLDDLVKDTANFTVKFTDHATGNEYPLTYSSSGKYSYNNGISAIKVIVVAKKDNENMGNETMHLIAPTDPVDVGNTSYLANVIADVGGAWSMDRAKYLFGTVMFRRCR